MGATPTEPVRRCVRCGSSNVAAKISGEYYCITCGTSVVLEHSKKIVQDYVRKYLGASTETGKKD